MVHFIYVLSINLLEYTTNVPSCIIMGDTIIEHKKAFLNSQIRILNTRLEPSRHWRDNLPIPEQGEIKGKVVQEVLHKRMLEAQNGGLWCF